ncbi:hypothetical protein GCM10027052_25710 [Parafrigoribacterium mesophilum]|uniref:hypothetical protein n=1 Tax=Parafrigoribacterium mesophilum TaxID=433646 RepID=UPI0031FBD6AF
MHENQLGCFTNAFRPVIEAAADPTLLAGSTQSLATLIAAAIAAVAAITAAIISGVNASKSRQWVGRDQWWTRFSWAIEKAISLNPRESELGLSVLIALIDVPWAKDEDNEMALAVADLIKTHSAPARRRWQR